MKPVFIAILICITALQSRAEVTVSSIIIKSESVLSIKSVNRIDHEEHRIVTILSEKGNFHSQLEFFEDNYQKTSSYDVIVKDSDGNVVARYNRKDFSRNKVIEAVSSYGEVDRYSLDCGLKRYPYTIETHYLFQKKTFLLGGYNFSEDAGTKVLNSTYTVFYPADFELRYDLNRPDMISVTSENTDGYKTLKFQLANSFSGQFESYLRESNSPVVYIVPKVFEYGKIAGSFDSWKQYGQWTNALWAGRDVLSEPAAAQIDKLRATYSEKNALAEAIYAYTQQNMRYVAITYGLGGLQTMSADETFNLGYGDCKALSNFTAAAMRYAGIEAYPALVYGGSEHPNIDPGKPMAAFNHVIVCLPAKTDTTWLECTDNSMPFGYLSNFTDNRYALLLKPCGGELIRTPTYPASANRTIRSARIELRANGSASIQLDCSYRNLAMQKTDFYTREFSSAQPIKAVKREVKIPSFDLENFNSDLYKNQEPVLNVEFTLEARNVGRKVGRKQLIKPFLFDLPVPGLNPDTTRVYPVYFKHGYEYTDSVTVVLPHESKIIQPLTEMEKENDFGSLSVKVSADSDQHALHIVRNIRLNGGEFPLAQYADLADFLGFVRGSREAFFIVE